MNFASKAFRVQIWIKKKLQLQSLQSREKLGLMQIKSPVFLKLDLASGHLSSSTFHILCPLLVSLGPCCLSSTSWNVPIKCARGPTTPKLEGRRDVSLCVNNLSSDLSFFQRSVHRTLQNISRTLHIKAPWGIHRPDVPGLFPAEGAEAPADFGVADWDAVQIRTEVHDSAKKWQIVPPRNAEH